MYGNLNWWFWYFNKNLISEYFYGDGYKLDHRLVPFKRINRIYGNHDDSSPIITDDPKLVDKASVRIDFLETDVDYFISLREFYKDKDPNFKIEKIELEYFTEDHLLTEMIEFINKFCPNNLITDWNEWTVENIKALTLLNWANVDITFNSNHYEHISFWFVNTPIQLYDSKADQMLTFEWESIDFSFIEEEVSVELDITGEGESNENEFKEHRIWQRKIEEVKLIETNTGNFLFIPLDTIGSISYSRLWEISSADDISKQFSDLYIDYRFYDDGFIVPLIYSNRILINANDEELKNCLNQCKHIHHMFKQKYLEIKIKSLGRLLEINKLLSDDFSSINSTYRYYDESNIEDNSISEITNSPDWSNLKFINIYNERTLLPDEFQFWWNVLRYRRTRFNLTTIYLMFSLLSECLTVLTLCLGWPELESVKLRYSEADIEDEDEVIEHAKSEFRQNFGIIQRLFIWKVWE